MIGDAIRKKIKSYLKLFIYLFTNANVTNNSDENP